jgi:hypothetical protein
VKQYFKGQMMQENVGDDLARRGSITREKTGFNNIEIPHRMVFSDRMLLTIFTVFRKYERGEILSRTFSKRRMAPAAQDATHPADKSRRRKVCFFCKLFHRISKRKKAWDIKKKSRLVESLLLNISIPMIYMVERTDGRIEVVDGQQRLDAIFDFLNNQYSLTGLSILKELNGKKFKDFEAVDTALQRKLEEYPLSILVIKRESPPGIGLEIFKRLNQ